MEVAHWLYPLVLSILAAYKNLERLILTLLFPLVKKLVIGRFRKAGIDLNGNGPAGITIRPGHEKEWILRVACDLELGLGEMYMEGLWECKSLDKFMFLMLKSEMYKEATSFRNSCISYLRHGLFNMQTMKKAFEVSSHYDLGNDLFESFLDPSMSYSCGYWRTAQNLNEAQTAKMELIAQKLKLREGMRVLDVGCGWGGLARHLAKNYGVTVVGVTIGNEGAEYARKVCAGLPVEIRVQDYRTLNEKFDRIVSVGMFEHVGSKNYREYFEVVNRCLVDDGIFLLHTIGVHDVRMEQKDPWTLKYIFPNGQIPYYRDVDEALEGLFLIEDWHNFGVDYGKTLLCWRDNFDVAWPQLESKYGNTFYRMWKFYLETSAGAFAARKLNLWQIILTKDGLLNGYDSVR